MERTITIEEPGIYREDSYELRMLYENRVPGLLDIKGRGVDGKSFYDYDVSGKVSLAVCGQRTPFRREELRQFLTQLTEVVHAVEQHLLSPDKILLHPSKIFCQKEQYFFCYNPQATGDFFKAFHTLTEYFVKAVDHEDLLATEMAMYLHRETMEENYRLERIISACLEMKEKRREKKREPERWIHTEGEYDSYYHDRFQGMEKKDFLKEEDFWEPMRRLLTKRKKKKDKWGDFEHLYDVIT